MSIKKYITVSIQLPGVHKWENCNIEEVKYLQNLHRHIFYIKCSKEVSHNDRDIEIIQFKGKIISYLLKKYSAENCLLFGKMSCEMIAEELINEFGLYSCEVLEDNENGALLIK